ncbi:alpha-D-ribose 1-methylphosphonate 5-triphosphate diphosphatase [Rhizobium straminoryzae]|uniref:Alpha-D-ribose 1-methylphosphonate 5-triphosphate diphosphatase n=1 Tax=Rhizobium straminoryzae TaxID=1387186 RepID=A0A549T3C1_9HYPH|nr:alpha-D-ribose 1-methylphosphonate 5-triphosphate diphosphatase [Rhizobium straminoryzae]TRL36342.1 alpha-D-ribose 1-methylphosphonate 5-triphosphate diphosphatase [Rhizobium straminoryzae]
MSQELILKNARIVLEDRIVDGALQIIDGQIADISEGVLATGEDLEGDFLIPGLVELHTDHLEQHYSPRPGVRWDTTAAIQAHDAQIATSGITTVFDCLRLGSDEDGGFERGEMRRLADAIEAAEAAGRLRAEHLIHLRCEVPCADVIDQFSDFEGDPRVRLASLMDHAPGQRQFQSLEQYVFFYKKKRGLSDEAFEAFMKVRKDASERYSAKHRDELAARCAERGITVASHDDATLAHVEEARGHGVRLAEFPTSLEAARASHAAGMSVLMGAPNVVRGKSHSGNIAARDLADLGVLDVLSSDYVPLSLLHAPFILADTVEGLSLPQAIAMVSATPAKTVGLTDRGRIAPGLRADLVRVHRQEGVPVSRSVWRAGRRVA